MARELKEWQDANERTASNSGGIESHVRPHGVPNQNKSNPGVSGRPLGPPHSRPAPPPRYVQRQRDRARATSLAGGRTHPLTGRTEDEMAAREEGDVRHDIRSRPPAPPGANGGPSQELPINVQERVRNLTEQQLDQVRKSEGRGTLPPGKISQLAERGTVPPEKVPTSNAEAVDGVPGRTKQDDVDPRLAIQQAQGVEGVGPATPQPPPPPLAVQQVQAMEGTKPGEEKTAVQQYQESLQESALATGAPVDPETGQLRKPGFDGQFTDEEGHALKSDGTPVVDTETGVPLSPEQAITQGLKAERGDTGNFMAEREAKAQQEKLRRAAPSEIPGINTGHFEKVTSGEDMSGFFRAVGAGMSEMRKKKYQANVRKQMAEFGDFPGSSDPDAPAPPIRPMGRSFNPYTGKFTGETGPNAFQMSGFDMEGAKREFYRKGGMANLPEPDNA